MGGQIDGLDDSVLDEIEQSERSETDNKSLSNTPPPVTIINTNARSLCPKIDSLIDCLEEMNSSVGIITETWLADGASLEDDITDLIHGAGVGLI